MKVYIVVNEDRHYDTQFDVFSDYNKARDFLDKDMSENSYTKDREEKFIEGTLYFVFYYSRKCCYYIIERVVDEPHTDA